MSPLAFPGAGGKSRSAEGAKAGAGEGNRTLVISLEGCCSTIELHPQTAGILPEGWPANRSRRAAKVGGGGRTRTYEGIASGFTVRPLCRSGHSPARRHDIDVKGQTVLPAGLAGQGAFMVRRAREVNAGTAISSVCQKRIAHGMNRPWHHDHPTATASISGRPAGRRNIAAARIAVTAPPMAAATNSLFFMAGTP